MIRKVAVTALAACFLSACHVNKAPADVGKVQPWFWENYGPGADSDVAAAIVSYDKLATIASATGDASDDSSTGTISVFLAASDLAIVNLGSDNPQNAPGLIAVTDMPCTLDQIEPLLYSKEQSTIHSGSYDSYARTYTSDLSAYKARTTETIAWTSTYKPNGLDYTATVSGGLRRIPDQGKTITPFGPIILARTWLPSPATFPSGSSESFKQDYQIEVYYERTPGHTVHSFVDWRDINVNEGPITGLTAFNTTYQSFILGNDVNWDQATAMSCGSPPAD